MQRIISTIADCSDWIKARIQALKYMGFLSVGRSYNVGRSFIEKSYTELSMFYSV